MGIYLGANALGGGGGSAPLGSLAFLVPSTTQNYVTNQEVLEEEGIGTFLKSGASLSPGGGGKEDASNYDASLFSIGVSVLNSNAFSYGDRNDRSGAFWNGTHIVQVGYESNGDLTLRAISQSDFSVSYSGNIGSSLWPSNGGILDGDYLVYAKSWMSSVPIPSSSPNFKRVLRSNLTSAASYSTASSVNSNGATVTWTAPSGYTSYPLFTACNQGLSSEKHYFAIHPGSTNNVIYGTVGQFTYNDGAATGTSPWTATGSTIVIPNWTSGTKIIRLAGDLNDLWVQTNQNILYKYNSTTLALEATIVLPPHLQTPAISANYSLNGLFIIPASQSTTGNARFFINVEPQPAPATPIYKEIFLGSGISAPNLFELTAHDGTNIKANGSNIAGWMKIK